MSSLADKFKIKRVGADEIPVQEQPAPVEEEKPQYYKPEEEQPDEEEEVPREQTTSELREEIEEHPIKEGYMKQTIQGEPVDARDFEQYQLAAGSPEQFSALFRQVASASENEHKVLVPKLQRPKMSKGALIGIILVVAVILIIGIALFLAPQIMAMFGGGG